MEIDSFNFISTYERTNLFINIADSKGKAGWSSAVPEFNLLSGHDVAVIEEEL